MNIIIGLGSAVGVAYLIKRCLFGRKVDVQASSQKRVKEPIPWERTIYLANRMMHPSMKTQISQFINRSMGWPVKDELSDAEYKELDGNIDLLEKWLKNNRNSSSYNSPEMMEFRAKIVYDLCMLRGGPRAKPLDHLDLKLRKIEKDIPVSEKKEDREIKIIFLKLVNAYFLEDKLVWMREFFKRNEDKNKSEFVTQVVAIINQWIIDNENNLNMDRLSKHLNIRK